ncbi:MAG: HAD family hydrolase [Steroidobacteraceae bacterium]
MQPEARAIIFDLDDTLYPLRRFILSGYGAVARHLEHTYGIDHRDVVRVLIGALRSERGHELQVCQKQFELPPAVIPALVDVIRAHAPNLRLPKLTRHVLARLRGSWRIGIVTNGMSHVQARKIHALGLDELVDTIVYATDFGPGKPDPEPFLEAARRLNLPVSQSVFVGDDPRCDIAGAMRAGMRAIYLQHEESDQDVDADATVTSLAAVPDIAEELVRARRSA